MFFFSGAHHSQTIIGQIMGRNVGKISKYYVVTFAAFATSV